MKRQNTNVRYLCWIVMLILSGNIYANSMCLHLSNQSNTPVVFNLKDGLAIGPVNPGETYHLTPSEFDSIKNTNLNPIVYGTGAPGITYPCSSFFVDNKSSCYFALINNTKVSCVNIHETQLSKK